MGEGSYEYLPHSNAIIFFKKKGQVQKKTTQHSRKNFPYESSKTFLKASIHPLTSPRLNLTYPFASVRPAKSLYRNRYTNSYVGGNTLRIKGFFLREESWISQ